MVSCRVEARRSSSPEPWADCRIQSPTCASLVRLVQPAPTRGFGGRHPPMRRIGRPPAARATARCCSRPCATPWRIGLPEDHSLGPATRRHVPIGSSLPPRGPIAGGSPTLPGASLVQRTPNPLGEGTPQLRVARVGQRFTKLRPRPVQDPLATGSPPAGGHGRHELLRHGKSSPAMCQFAQPRDTAGSVDRRALAPPRRSSRAHRWRMRSRSRSPLYSTIGQTREATTHRLHAPRLRINSW